MSINSKVFKWLSRSSRQLNRLSREDLERIRAVRAANYTYLSENRLANIVSSIRKIEDSGIRGDIIEAGCALGGSAILMAQTKSDDRALNVYDVFGMIPEPSEEDGDDVHARYEAIKSGDAVGLGGDLYYGYEDDLYSKVSNAFAEFGVDRGRQNVSLIKGLVQDTLKCDNSVAFAHIDVDWYDPVMTCLERIAPKLSVGGVIILDDYTAWSGCREATDKYFADKTDSFKLEMASGALMVTRRA